MRRRTLLAFLAFLPAACPAEEAWVKATSKNFEVYTTAGEPKAREAALYFERVDNFLRKALGASREGAGRVRVIAFQSSREYRPYQPAEGRVGYAGGDLDLDEIVMESISPERYPVAVHEYVHILLKPYKNVPLWFDEGLAQVYQTLRPFGGKVVVGDPIPGALDLLQHARWLDLDTLCAVDRSSPYYTGEQSKATIFYAESWLLTHMLFLGEKYGTGFREFKRLTLTGVPADEAFEGAFNKTLWHVYSDLRRYAEDGGYRGPVFNVALEESAADPKIEPVTALESRLILARLLADIGKPEESRTALRKLAEESPTRPEVPEALGYAALRKGDADEARAEFARAVELGSANPRVYYRYSALAAQAGEPVERQIALLRRAVDLDPEYAGARLHLGHLLASAADYAGALAQFRRVKEPPPDQAFAFYRAVAYASSRTGDRDGARANAKLAAEAAHGADEQASAKKLLAAIEEPVIEDRDFRPAAHPSALRDSFAGSPQCQGQRHPRSGRLSGDRGPHPHDGGRASRATPG
jgi:Flp pilus assembly protein TadD